MIIAGLILAALAAVLHVYIFWMESVTWTSKQTRAVFGLSEAQADATKEMAFNQGFYNLFLAIIAAVGIALYFVSPLVGIALVLAGVGAMLAAAVVLFVSSPDKRGAAYKQGTLPLLSVVAIVAGFLLEFSR